MPDTNQRRLGKCIEVYPTETQGWVVRTWRPNESQQTLHAGFGTVQEALAQYGGNDPEWPVFVLTAPPSDVAE